MKNLQFLAFLLFLSACSNSGTPPATQEEPSISSDTVAATPTPAETAPETLATPETTERNAIAPPSTFPKEFSSGAITFKIESPETERNATVLKVQGRQPNQFSKEFSVEGNVQDAFLLDLNEDGFSELYLAIAAPDGQIGLKGYASYRDRSAGEIYVKDKKTEKQSSSDQVFVENGQLFRSFISPSGKPVKVKYQLQKGETSFVLSPVN